jgi:hypothetical protein
VCICVALDIFGAHEELHVVLGDCALKVVLRERLALQHVDAPGPGHEVEHCLGTFGFVQLHDTAFCCEWLLFCTVVDRGKKKVVVLEEACDFAIVLDREQEIVAKGRHFAEFFLSLLYPVYTCIFIPQIQYKFCRFFVCRMSSPATALASLLHSFVLWFGVLWFTALVVGRIYAFHEAYVTIQQQVADDAKLLELCSSPDFVKIMKQHNDICSRVKVDAGVSVLLKALNQGLAAPTLCGRDACVNLLLRLSIWSGWTGIFSALAVALCLPQLIRSVLLFGGDRRPEASAMLKPVSYRRCIGEGGV